MLHTHTYTHAHAHTYFPSLPVFHHLGFRAVNMGGASGSIASELVGVPFFVHYTINTPPPSVISCASIPPSRQPPSHL